MLYDRLLRDLHDAADAISQRDPGKANTSLQHAQEIVTTLDDALDLRAWPAGESLAQIYEFLGGHLVAANLSKSAPMVNECLALVEPLASAWHEAYTTNGSGVRSNV
jgi:flagellar secretion chaperone FliS